MSGSDSEQDPKNDPESKVVSLDDHRIRTQREFDDDMVAYVECLWGKKTFAFNAAVRDLEKMRRGEEDRTLRPPETDWEALHVARHVRALANDILRHFGLEAFVRKEDDIPERPQRDG